MIIMAIFLNILNVVKGCKDIMNYYYYQYFYYYQYEFHYISKTHGWQTLIFLLINSISTHSVQFSEEGGGRRGWGRGGEWLYHCHLERGNNYSLKHRLVIILCKCILIFQALTAAFTPRAPGGSSASQAVILSCSANCLLLPFVSLSPPLVSSTARSSVWGFYILSLFLSLPFSLSLSLSLSLPLPLSCSLQPALRSMQSAMWYLLGRE